MSWIRKTVPFVRRSSGAMAASSPTMISENRAALMAFDSEVGEGEGRGEYLTVPLKGCQLMLQMMIPSHPIRY